ncbi:MAG: hypothetical protein WCQ72_00060 [Eubacteriales bacterium]
MNNVKRVMALLLAALLCAASLASCGSESGTPAVTTAAATTASDTAAETTTQLKPDVPEDSDFGGYEFKVLTKGQFDIHWKSKDIYAEELNGEPINDAVFNRNSKIGEKYNFTVSEKVGTSTDASGEAKKAILAGEEAYDMILLGSQLNSLITGGMLVNLNNIPYIDLTKPWYDQNANASLSIDHKLYVTAGDLMIMDNDATWTLLFNKSLAEDLGVGNLYDKVNDGTWTLDALHDCIVNASRDINGDGVQDEFDQWGIEGESFNTTALILGAGEHIIAKDDNDLPYIAMQTERFYTAFEKANSINGDFSLCLYAGKYSAKYPDSSLWSDCMDKTFTDGRSLFNFAGLNRVSLFRTMETDFGIVPIPKFDENQTEYYNVVSLWCANLLAVPKTASDLERTGIIIEALSAESMYTLTPAYYDITLKTKSSRDEQSSDMLDLIFSSRVFDLANLFGWGGLFDLAGGQTDSGKNEIASAVEKKLKSAQSAMDKSVNYILEDEG